MTDALEDLVQRWRKEARHWQDRAEGAGAARSYAAAYEFMTRAEQYVACAAQLELAMRGMPTGGADARS
jgi:hypothetical protein